MSNYHSDKWIFDKLTEHYKEALNDFPQSKIIALCLQGSQNYGLDTSSSDVDSRLLVVPSFEDIAMNKKPISTTHIRENDEHIDYKDIRLAFNCFRKQNLNFMEILFTPYCFVNPLYENIWKRLTDNKEAIAHYSPFTAIKTMKGVAMEKYHAMEHRYPSRVAIIDKFSYDPKQLMHLLRVEEYLKRYMTGEDYEDCLHPLNTDYLQQVKLGIYDLDAARKIAKSSIDNIIRRVNKYCNTYKVTFDSAIDDLLNRAQYEIMETAVREELKI